MLILRTDTKRCQKCTSCMPKFKDKLFNVASTPQWWMKTLQTETNSKFRVYKMQQQLLIAAGSHVCNTSTRQNSTFTNTQTRNSSFDNELLNANSWDWPCTGTGRVCCSHDWSSPGPLQNRHKSGSSRVNICAVYSCWKWCRAGCVPWESICKHW